MKKLQKYLITLLMCSFAATSFIGMASCGAVDEVGADLESGSSVATSSDVTSGGSSSSSESSSSSSSSSSGSSSSSSGTTSEGPEPCRHVWQDATITPVTCEADGLRVKSCKKCKEEKERVVLEKLGHRWEWDTLEWEKIDKDGEVVVDDNGNVVMESYTGYYCVTDNCGQLASQELDYEWDKDKKGYKVVGAGNCYDEKVYIPAEYEGSKGKYPVVGIGKDFCDYSVITCLEVIGDLEYIEDGAFSGCYNLEKVVFNGAVKTIGDNTFVACKKLANIQFNGGLESIGASSFNDCVALKEINLPFKNLGSTPVLGDEAFLDCTALEKVVIGSSTNAATTLRTELKAIPDKAFAGCKSLKEAVLGEGIETIGEGAFSKCKNLLEIIIPDSVEEIKKDAFSGCASAEKISIGYLLDNSKLETIGESAFSDCKSLKVLRLPTALMQVSAKAFSNADKLEEVHIANINAWCNITFDNAKANPLYSGKAFLYIENEKITDVVISNEVTNIAPYAFYNYKNMTSLVIGSKVTTIGENAFYGCSNLAAVTYNAVKCGDLASDAYAFDKAGRKAEAGITLTIGKDVKKIPAYLFAAEKKSTTYAADLRNIVFEECVQDDEICTHEEHIVSNCTSIGKLAFKNCLNLESVVMGSSVSKIAESAFENCAGLNKLVFTDIATGVSIGEDAFKNCDKIEELVCDATTAEVLTISKVKNLHIFRGNIAEELFKGKSSLHTLIIGENVKKIETKAFADCNSLEKVELGGLNLKIDYRAFYSCGNLKEILFSENVLEIGEEAFLLCSNLTDLVLSDSVTKIDEGAFKKCYKLSNVTIGANVKEIGAQAFASCSKIKNVDFKERKGWNVKGTEIEKLSTTVLADPSTAAEYLRKTYVKYSWSRA